MRRCSKEAMARCPLSKYCEPGAEFTDDCACAKFNDEIMEVYERLHGCHDCGQKESTCRPTRGTLSCGDWRPKYGTD